ncbi:hypothetical protein Q5P01_002487 [Channa striata]|uniref:AIG1-type G domain-containing protein n=1 Tax=Channa striata TaxID=64152 RepID=A0AA88T844_CHASR|nr:hypothetical protein Q5P01_002487 [Channa striata]
MDAPNTRIVLLGKTGVGKSSLVNTIFGEQVFAVGHSINSETTTCQTKTGFVNGRNITVIDIPGLFDTQRSEEELKPEIVRCITECAPGPHAFLIVLKVEKFTEHEKAVIDKICQYFSEEVLKYSTIVFTHGDQLDEDQTIEDFISQHEFFIELVQKCGGRCHVVDNKYWNIPRDEYRSNQFQVEELLKTIDKTVLANNGGCYTNEMLQAVETEIQQDEELIRQSSENMSEEEIRRQARDRADKKLMIKLVGVTTGALLGALLGVVGMVGAVLKLLTLTSQSKNMQQALRLTTGITLGRKMTAATAEAAASRTATAVSRGGTVVAAVLGAVEGGLIGYDAAKEAKTPLEAIEKAGIAVITKPLSIIDELKKKSG